MSLHTILEHLKEEEQNVLSEINQIVQHDKDLIIAALSKGETIEHNLLVKAHTYYAEIKAVIAKVEELINWKAQD